MRIPQQIAKHASDVTVSFDPSTWSVRLHNAVAKNLRGGLIVGNGSAAQIAAAYRQSIGAPTVYTYGYGGVWWANIPKEHDLWDQLTDLVTTVQLRGETRNRYWMDRMDGVLVVIAERRSSGGVYYGDKEDVAAAIRPTLPEIAMPTGVFTIKYKQ
jgi:hypothetical protein